MYKRMLCSLLFVVGAYASPAFAYTTYSGTLAWIGTDWSGAGYLLAINGVTNQCGNNQFSLNAGAAGYKDQVATLALAWGLQEPVSVVTDASNSCPNSRANIISVQIPTQ